MISWPLLLFTRSIPGPEFGEPIVTLVFALDVGSLTVGILSTFESVFLQAFFFAFIFVFFSLRWLLLLLEGKL